MRKLSQLLRLASKPVAPSRPMVEPLTLPMYAMIALGVILTAILVPLAGFTVTRGTWTIFLLWPYVAFAGMLLRRVGHAKMADFVEGTALIYGEGLAFMLLLFPLTVMSLPLADKTLADVDAALGFNWIAYARFIEPAIGPLVLAYKSFNWQPLLVVIILVVTGRRERLWQFVLAPMLSVPAGCFGYMLAPAEGPFAYYDLRHYTLLDNGQRALGPIINLIKSGHRIISPDLFTGFISMPSYHALSATLFAWALWPLRYWRWPIVFLNVALIAAAPVVGDHYFVDLIAGVLLATASIYGAKKIIVGLQNRPAWHGFISGTARPYIFSQHLAGMPQRSDYLINRDRIVQEAKRS